MAEEFGEKTTVSGTPEKIKELKQLEADVFKILMELADESYMELVAETGTKHDLRPAILNKFTLDHIHRVITLTMLQNNLYENLFIKKVEKK